MSYQEARNYLDRTRRKVILIRFIEIFIISVAISLLVMSSLLLFAIDGIWPYAIAIPVGLIFLVIRLVQRRIFAISNTTIASYLNRRYPVLEEGADLILKGEDDLTSIQQLQRTRSIQHLATIYPSIKLPNRIVQATSFLVIGLLGYLLISRLPVTGNTPSPDKSNDAKNGLAELPASIQNAEITITPPAYTKVGVTSTNNLNLRVPEGALVEWQLTFTGKATDPQFIFSGNDSVKMERKGSVYTLRHSCRTSAFYNISWKTNVSSAKSSDFYQIEVVKDSPPLIVVNNLNQFSEFSIDDKPSVHLLPTITDDYSLQDAYVVATVSKGSGESVKFRELKMNFDNPKIITGPSVKASLKLDIIKLGLEPGDELYFYIEAQDNKMPAANKARTETYFISLRDTSSIATTVDAGLGVDLMPEYFRSQRQIIIDSEKLLREKKAISRESFNARSNSLAYDQKVLRLRYGEFLGEEFESGIGPQATIEEAHSEEGDVTQKYGHVHDKDNEHNLVEEKKQGTKEAHAHTEKEESDPLKEYTHSHDSQEEATFFTQSIRTKLKAAITIMWDAELHLRLYDPGKSLPFQYRALKLLKEISQDSRVYVHRTGFEPPPLKEEKRLTGDLAEIKNSSAVNERIKGTAYPHIRKALQQIEYLVASKEVTLTVPARKDFEQAGQELAGVAIQQPGRYLRTLTMLKALSQNELESASVQGALIEVRKSLWQLLPLEASSPETARRNSHKLDDEFLESLELLKRE